MDVILLVFVEFFFFVGSFWQVDVGLFVVDFYVQVFVVGVEVVGYCVILLKILYIEVVKGFGGQEIYIYWYMLVMCECGYDVLLLC